MSAPSPALRMCDVPWASSASISARWLIDLSPGRRSSPARPLAGWIVRSGAVRSDTVNVAISVLRQGAVRGPDVDARLRGAVVEAAHVLVDRDEVAHEPLERLDRELLLRVGEGGVRVGVHLDHDTVRADRHAAERERPDQPALPGGMARIDDHG